ncbi:MAG: hypothetical protein CMG57_07495 [Candidatus Marinimicrobia bacterium]|nr:hypothetical protein [Candidatus Neomarinimicrobiota bacterium]|tara:strand:- start:959 stop:1138 length:180 start_codon:yes stop_codon:yes gene_type:complete
MPKVNVIKHKNYCIVSAFNEDKIDLVEAVGFLLSEGWKLAGGVASSSSVIYQALYHINE